MAKRIQGLFGEKGLPKKDIKKFIKKNGGSKIICYVLITCSESDGNGEMEVEMKYEGDKYLASYMIESAANIMEGQ